MGDLQRTEPCHLSRTDGRAVSRRYPRYGCTARRLSEERADSFMQQNVAGSANLWIVMVLCSMSLRCGCPYHP